MSYPYLSDWFRDVVGVELPLPIPMFGLMVAIALMVGTKLFQRELQRLIACGHIPITHRLLKNKSGQLVEHVVSAEEIATGLTLAVALAGIVGARVFSILEYPAEFIAHPFATLVARSGFTYFGGLIFGMFTGAFYLRAQRLPIPLVLDAVAPILMLGYGIGRIGCQLAGDGDWGIAANLALKPSWLPIWSWAQTYQHNIAAVNIAGPGVYPTPLYEMLVAFGMFAILWRCREHTFRPGWLFSLYLLLSGIERFSVELIRVNTQLHIFGIGVTQAQLISVALVVLGAAGLIILSKPERSETAIQKS